MTIEPGPEGLPIIRHEATAVHANLTDAGQFQLLIRQAGVWVGAISVSEGVVRLQVSTPEGEGIAAFVTGQRPHLVVFGPDGEVDRLERLPIPPATFAARLHNNAN